MKLRSAPAGAGPDTDPSAGALVGRSTLTQRHVGRPPDDQRALEASVRSAAWAPVQLSRDAHSGLDDAGVQAAAAHGIAGGGQPLPYLDAIQRSFGDHDVSGVTAHFGGAAAEANQALGANAYATGDHVAFADSAPSLFLVAHEAAHVVQQRAGVHLSSAVGQAGDAYEQHADAVAEKVVRGESAAELLGTPAGAAPVQRVQRKESTTSIDAKLVGHASPRWEHTKGKSSAELNLKLSADRVAAVERYLKEVLARKIAARGGALDIAFTTSAMDHDQAKPTTSTDAKGDTETIVEAGGDAKRDDAAMKRVDITLTVWWHVSGESSGSRAGIGTVPRTCLPEASTSWSICVDANGGAGHAGVGLTAGGGTLYNTDTGQKARFTYVGPGVGLGISTPSAAIDQTPTPFTTFEPVTFHDFDGCQVLVWQAGLGIGFIGYNATFMKFIGLTNSIWMPGWTIAGAGADVGTNDVVFDIDDFPEPVCTKERQVPMEEEEVTPYEVDLPNVFTHRVLFATGSATVGDAELADLESFADQVMASYDNPDPEVQR